MSSGWALHWSRLSSACPAGHAAYLFQGTPRPLTAWFHCPSSGLHVRLYVKCKGAPPSGAFGSADFGNDTSAELFLAVIHKCTKYHILVKIVDWFHPSDPEFAPLVLCKGTNFDGHYAFLCASANLTPVSSWGHHPLRFLQAPTNIGEQAVHIQYRKMVGASTEGCIALDVANCGTEVPY